MVQTSCLYLDDTQALTIAVTHKPGNPAEQHAQKLYVMIINDICIYVTYLPHEAVAEVSKDKEPIGRERAEFNWFESQLMSDSNELRVKWFGCHLVWDSNDFGCQLMLWRSKQSISARLPSKTTLWRWKTKHFCETSFKIEALKLKNEAFLRDFLQNWSFEAQKRSISARLPSKMKLWSSKTKLFCETSFKNEALKLQNEAFLRDFLQKWHVDRTLDLRIPIRFNDFQMDASKVLHLPRKSCAEAYELL